MENNCVGCKWLDEVKGQNRGNGYCCMVVRSINYKNNDDCIRKSNYIRCELYENGDFNKRYDL